MKLRLFFLFDILIGSVLSLIPVVSIDFIPDKVLQHYGGGSNEATSVPCIHTQLLHCQAQFNAHLNISGFADWTNSNRLAYAIDKLYNTGISGLLKVCYARSSLYQCLGVSYPSCINRMHFLSENVPITAAYQYVALFKDMEFDCNGGFLQSIQSWQCVLYVHAANEDHYKLCFDKFNQTITGHPDQYCPAAQQLLNCARFPLLGHCQYATGWWECERLRLALQLDAFCPSISCNIGLKRDQSPQSKLSLVQDLNHAHNLHSEFLGAYEAILENDAIPEE